MSLFRSSQADDRAQRRAREQQMADAAVAEVARHVIAHVVESNPPQWEDYPDIGEHDWAAVEEEVARRLAVSPASGRSTTPHNGT